MQINIDTTKLPEGMKVSEVYEIILCSMSGYISDQERPGYECEEEKTVLNALIDPSEEGKS